MRATPLPAILVCVDQPTVRSWPRASTRDRLEFTGPPVLLWRGLGVGAFGVADIALAHERFFALHDGLQLDDSPNPTWVTRDGASAPLDPRGPTDWLYSLALSAGRIAVGRGIHQQKVQHEHRVHLGQAPQRRRAVATDIRGNDTTSDRRWSRDGRDILFISDRAGSPALYRQRADGSAPAQRVASDANAAWAKDSNRLDGQWLVLRYADAVCCDILGIETWRR